MPERLLRPRQFWEALNVARSTFYDLKSKGLLPAPVRLGKRALAWRETDVDEFIKSLAAKGGISEN